MVDLILAALLQEGCAGESVRPRVSVVGDDRFLANVGDGTIRSNADVGVLTKLKENVMPSKHKEGKERFYANKNKLTCLLDSCVCRSE